MKILRELDSLGDELRGSAVAIGNFDGVHRGHARIVEGLLATARRVGGRAVVFTFDPHPAALLRPDAAPAPLSTLERKADLLAELGVDALIAYPTNRALLELSPQEFFDQLVVDRLAAKALVEGTNFYFGHARAGDIALLGSLTKAAGIGLEVVEPLVVDGEPVSSSRVRRLVAAGEVAVAARLLTRPYACRGTVVRGAGRGAGIGFPTANLAEIRTLLPRDGVYAGVGRVVGRVGGASWPAAVNLGPNPTFGEESRKLEVHLVGCEADLYGREVEVDFRRRLRDIQPFDSLEELKDQLARDVAAASEGPL